MGNDWVLGSVYVQLASSCTVAAPFILPPAMCESECQRSASSSALGISPTLLFLRPGGEVAQNHSTETMLEEVAALTVTAKCNSNNNDDR